MRLRKSNDTYTMVWKTATRTGRDCYLCEDGEFLQVKQELVCDNCYHSPDGKQSLKKENPWEDFWAERKNYSGFTGRDRIKMVGGFVQGYVDEDGTLRV